MSKPANKMTAEELVGNRKWPAHFTCDQMRAQIAWEQHPDSAETTARIRAELKANSDASRRGWEKEQRQTRERRRA
jgi:hypothetical protein